MQFWNSSPCQTWNKSHQPQAWPPSGLESGGGSLPQPPCRAWSCRPWRTWPRMTKFAWKYAVIHYSKSPWPKNNKKLWYGEFFHMISFFFRGCKNCRNKKQKNFFDFLLKKIWLGTFFGSVLTIFISFSGYVFHIIFLALPCIVEKKIGFFLLPEIIKALNNDK